MSIHLVHNVYFTLKEPTTANIEGLIAACHKYLPHHDGVVYYSAGTLCDDLRREVNDVGFHVGLSVVFKDRAAHDVYQVSANHKKFIEECKEGWAKVRVFDSNATTGA
jgi:hypothetical protein